jgi:3'(2'), 5'-bisphosphate nucleotidase
VALAREAGAAILQLYRHNAQYQTKDDGSPLTAADLRSHEILSSGLQQGWSLPVLSEEHVVDFATRSRWHELWLIDPLDGTKEFLAHNDEFTVNIALIRGAQPVIGIVYAPALEEFYYAEAGFGAFQVRGGDWDRLPSTSRWAERCIAVSRSHDSPATAQFAQANGFECSQRIGSALKFARLARGDVSIYPRFTGSCEWDIAAGHCVVEAAGCRIIELQSGAPPRYNKPDLYNGHFIAFAPTIDYAALKLPA